MPNRVHHTAFCPLDMEASVRFYRDGLGFELLMDHRFDGDWLTLFGVRSDRLRSVFLGDPADSQAGIVELVDFGGDPPGAASASAGRAAGFFLVSIFTHVDATLERLAGLGVEAEGRITVLGVAMATVRDPDGNLVELIETG